MIQFIKHKDIDKAWWDATLEQCSNKLPYASSWMLDAVAPGWHALIDRERQLLFPLPWRKKYGIKYIFAPFPLQQLGLFAPAPFGQKELDGFLDHIPSTFKKVDLQVNVECETDHKSFRIEEMVNTTLALGQSLEDIRSNYAKNQKRNIKKHKGSGAEISELEDPMEVVRVFHDWKLPELQGEGVEFENVERLIEACEERNAGFALASRKDGELIAAAYFITYMGRVIYLKGASNAEGKRLGSMHAIIDAAIERTCGSFLIFDFGGSNNPSLARFYKGFGATTSVYLHLVQDVLPGLVKRIKFRK